MIQDVEPKALLEQLRKQSVQVRTEVDAGGIVRLKLKPSPTAELLDQVRAHKEELINALVLEAEERGRNELPCPVCHKPTRQRKCWGCGFSICPCGRQTGSAFISVCRPCEVAEYRRLGVPY